MRIIDRLILEVKKNNITKEEAIKKLKKVKSYLKNYDRDIKELKLVFKNV